MRAKEKLDSNNFAIEIRQLIYILPDKDSQRTMYHGLIFLPVTFQETFKKQYS